MRRTIVLAAALLAPLGAPAGAEGEDMEPPVLAGWFLGGHAFQPGDTLTLTVTVEDDSLVDVVYAQVHRVGGGGYFQLRLDDDVPSGTHTLSTALTGLQEGTWRLAGITMQDERGNSRFDELLDATEEERRFGLGDPDWAGDVEGPTLASWSLGAHAYGPGDTVTMEANMADESLITAVVAGVWLVGGEGYFQIRLDDDVGSGTHVLSAVPGDQPEGTWRVEVMELHDEWANSNSYALTGAEDERTLVYCDPQVVPLGPARDGLRASPAAWEAACVLRGLVHAS